MKRLAGVISTRAVAMPVLLALGLVAGCSKKTDNPASSASTPPPAEAPAAPVANADAGAPPPPSGPVLDSSQMVGDAKTAMADADAAIRQKEYEKAVRTMLAIQQANLNAQQAELARQQMANLQRNLASAVANGDPNAKAAADLIRAAHSH
jgi:hypothetical protein